MSREAVAFLSGSPDRLALLEYLAGKPAAPRDVADELDVSTRSAQRNLSELADRGWAVKRDGRYRLTTTGHLVRETYADCLDRMDALEAFGTLYEHLPGPVDAPDPALIAGATYVTADADHPQAPILSRIFHEPHARQVQRGATTDVVLPTDRVEAAREQNPLEFEAVLTVPSFTLYRTDRPVEFGLTVTDDRTFVLAYDEEGHLRACVDGSDPSLREWAVDRFEAYRREASEVEGIGPF